MLSRREVKKRIKEQRPLPDEVLTQYPDLFKGMDIKPVKVARNPIGAPGYSETVLYGTRKGSEFEELLSTQPELFEKVKQLASADGFTNFRVAIIDLSKPPDFSKTLRGKSRNPSSPSAIKRHVRKHLDADQREYRKMIQDDDELKRWMEENPYSSRSRFKHERIESPSKFDKRSFRTITQPDGTEVTIGCPTGKFDAKRKRCKVGTRAQRVLKPKRRRKNPGRPIHTVKVFSNGEIEVK